MRRKIAIAILFIAATACVTVSPGSEHVVHSYVLQPEPQIVRASVPCADVLMVSPPRALAGLDSRRMLYSEQASELRRFVYNEWSDRPAVMLEPLIIQAIESTGRFHAVVGVGNGILPNLRLDTRVVSFFQDFSTEPSLARVAMRFQLVDLDERTVLATAFFEETEPAPSDDPYGGVMAINIALTRVLERASLFVYEVDVPSHF